MAISDGCFLFTLILSGALVGFSYDSRERVPASWSPTEALSILQGDQAPSYHFKLLVADPETTMDSLPSSSDVPVHLCLNQFQANGLLASAARTVSWLKSHLTSSLHGLSISSILVNSTGNGLPCLLPTLRSVQDYLRTLNLDRSVNVSPMFSLSSLENLDAEGHECIRSVVRLVRDSRSYVVVEALVDAQTDLGEDFVRSTVQRALSACGALSYLDIPIELHVKSSVPREKVEMGRFIGRMTQAMGGHALLANRISGLFLDVAPLGESNPTGQLASSHRRVLLGHGRGRIKPAHATIHDIFPPITYPATTPITVPATIPPPAIVTVPSTNPVTFIPTNPTVAPITVAPTNPVNTPITTPATNPLPTSVAGPGTYPVTAALPGQTWCVARTGLIDAALQNALDYACGIGGVDCSALQPMGSCYNPNSLQAHASYAFNSYYQKNPVATSCDFGGAGMLVNTNPSSGTCIYASSSSVPNYNNPVSTYNPVNTTTGTTPVSGSTPGSGLTPVTYPTNPPDNPVTTYPTTPTWNSPSIAPPVTGPGTFPVTPTVTPASPGQTWCVARAGVMDAALQIALNYACGIGGADCTALQPMGSCYNPNSLQAHASYAFNSYYQKNPVATSCDFGGTAMLVNVNPSSGTCIYPSSSSTPNYIPVSTYNPTTATTGTTPVSGSTPSSGSSNINSGVSSPSAYGSNSPPGTLSGSLRVSAGWASLVLLLAASCISINVHVVAF